MAHLYLIEDGQGDLIDFVAFCSDWCHQSWCRENGHEYQGWNGCQDGGWPVPCTWCQEAV